MGEHSGVFGEPAAAASVPGLKRALEEELVDKNERIVLMVTGHGLKDIPAAEGSVLKPDPIDPRLEAVADRLGV